MATCEIISVGTELLLGDILNTDAQFLSTELAKMGFTVLFQTTVGDNPDRLRSALEAAGKRSDIIITSGGLGPTPDDLTKEICCEYFGKKCYLHNESLERMKRYFESKNIVMPENNIKQAMLPEDCTVFTNYNGTAPGCAMEKDGKRIILLPGPPRELTAMFFESVVPYLSELSKKTIVSHQIRTFGIGESVLAQMVDEYLDGSNPTVAPYAKDGEALLRVTAMADSKKQADDLCEPLIKKITSMLGENFYGVDEPNIECAVVKKLKEKNMIAATAESCTGGLISQRITSVPGSSEVFQCGIVSYANEIKHRLLNVDEKDLEKFGAVSSQVAEQMALGVLKLSGADVAVSVTGIAGPGSDNTNKPVGLSYIGLAAKDGTVFVKELITGHNGKNCREYNRYVSASNALNLVRLFLDGKI